MEWSGIGTEEEIRSRVYYIVDGRQTDHRPTNTINNLCQSTLTQWSIVHGLDHTYSTPLLSVRTILQEDKW